MGVVLLMLNALLPKTTLWLCCLDSLLWRSFTVGMTPRRIKILLTFVLIIRLGPSSEAGLLLFQKPGKFATTSVHASSCAWKLPEISRELKASRMFFRGQRLPWNSCIHRHLLTL